VVEVSLLGPLDVTVAGAAVPITGSKQRSLVAMLALHANRNALQVDALDIDEFERESAAGTAAVDDGRWPDALEAYRAALACWRGEALADARGSAILDAAAVRLDEPRLAVAEMKIDARLGRGESPEVVPELEQMVADHPLREQLRGQLMPALYRSGRQADALAAYRSARATLIDELGIEPGRGRCATWSKRSSSSDRSSTPRPRASPAGSARDVPGRHRRGRGPHRSSRRAGRAPLGGQHADRPRSLSAP
jgi:DNA-binding SARP family transcriptional activator